MFFPGKLKGGVLVLVSALLFVATGVAAAGVNCPENPSGYISDYAEVLEDDSQLEEALEAFEKETGHEVYVAVVDSLGESSGEDYATTLFNKWGIGKENLDNGALFLVGVNDRQVHIKSGYGLSSYLTGEVTKTIIDNDIAPAFSTGDFQGGVVKGVESILAAIQGDYRQEVEDNNGQGHWVFLIILLLVIASVVVISMAGGQKRRQDRFKSHRHEK